MESRTYYRIYQEDQSWYPKVIKTSEVDELNLDGSRFITPYKYDDQDQAESARLQYIQHILSFIKFS
jgi:hypothetical protein